MNFATYATVASAMNSTKAELADKMRAAELDMGHTLVSEAPWLLKDDWHPRTIISQDGRRVRLVALQANRPGSGAFTRLIGLIFAAGLTPVLVEPSQSLIDWCRRHDFRRKRIGGKHKHTVWYPRR